MIEVCEKFIVSGYGIHYYNESLDDDDIIDIIKTQRKMKSIIYKE